MFARRSLPLTILAIGTCVSLFGGCGNDSPVAKDSKKDSAIRVKTVAAVETDVAKKTRQPATVHAYFETEIRGTVSGFVSELGADIGDAVRAGEVLAKIDVPEMQDQRLTIKSRIALLTAEEQAAASGVDLADASVRSAKAKLAQAESELGREDASLAAAKAEFDRTKDLVDRGSLQQRVLDEVRKKRDSQIAAKQAVSSAVQSAAAEVAVAEAQRAAAAAKLQTAKAQTTVTMRQLDELDTMIGYTTLIAPFDGVVTARNVNPGDLIDAPTGSNTKPLFVLSQVNKVRVHIPVPESDAPFVQPGDAISLAFPSLGAAGAMTATVTRTSRVLDASTRTMTVEAEIENANSKLLPGMFGEASIDLDTKVAARMLPSRAVRFDETGNAFTYVIESDNRVRIADVKIGIDTGSELEILSGLDAGEVVIDAHLKRFTDGQQVQPL